MSSGEPFEPPPGRATGRGLGLIGAATVLAGIGGYVITTVVARGLGDDYTPFAVFWSGLYLLAGGLSGIQQEFSRAARPTAGARTGASVWRFTLIATAIVLVLVAGTSPLWGPGVFGDVWPALVLPLSLGAAAYVVVAAGIGVLYGVLELGAVALVVVVDVALRLAALSAGLLLGWRMPELAWPVVVPYAAVIAIILIAIRHPGRISLDVGERALVANVARTVVAALATAVLVSGFPILLEATTPGAAAAGLGAVVFAIVLARAPLVVSTLALQSYLVVHLRDAARPLRFLTALLAGSAVLVLVLSLAAWVWGADLIVLLAGPPFALPDWFVAALVLTSLATAWVTLSGAAALARGLHTAYTAGWIAAAAGSVLLLLLPGDLLARTAIALGAGPLAGLVVHLVALVRSRRRGLPAQLVEPQ